MKKLMVYGTLRTGEGNHHLMKNSKKITDTIIHYRDYEGNHILTPVTAPINEHICEAEIYEVPEKDYEQIKEFEERFGYKDVVFQHGDAVHIFIPYRK